jgi:hypothetical protein
MWCGPRACASDPFAERGARRPATSALLFLGFDFIRTFGWMFMGWLVLSTRAQDLIELVLLNILHQ